MTSIDPPRAKPSSSLKERMSIGTSTQLSFERHLDAEELFHKVLPRCRVRPYVYGQIARLSQEVQNEADALARAEAAESGEEYAELRRSPLTLDVQDAEGNDVNAQEIHLYTLEDRRLDIALLHDIVSSKRRPYVTLKLNRGRKVLQEELLAAERSQRARKRKNRREHSLTLQTCTAVLPHLRDRPNLYNQVCAHISMLVDGDGGDWSSAPSSTLDSDNFSASSSSREVESHVSESQELWKDVRRLDELIEFMTDGTFVKSAFQTMRQNIEMEAKAAQKMEAERHHLADDSSSSTISESAGFHRQRTKLDPTFDDIPVVHH